MDLPQMGAYEWLIVAGALLGPVAAVQVQKWVERVRAIEHRKENVFLSLMATRAARTSPEHTRALNSIDLAFYGKRILGRPVRSGAAQAVIDAWRAYFTHLSPAERRPRTNEEFAAWAAKGEELFLNLLEKLAAATRFQFKRDELQSNYTSEHQAVVDNDLTLIRQFAVQILSGQRAVPVATLSGDNFLTYLAATDTALLSQVLQQHARSTGQNGPFYQRPLQPAQETAAPHSL